MFTFSRLLIKPKARVRGNILQISNQHQISLYISSPMIQDFIQHLVVGLFQNQQIDICNSRVKSAFFVERVEACAMPEFSSPLQFKSLSPIVVTQPKEYHGRLQKHYYRPDEEGLSERIRQSLTKKYNTTFGAMPDEQQLEFKIDMDYLKRRGGGEKTMTLVKIKEGQKDQTNIKGFLAPFELSGSLQLIQTAWDCGIGDQCSLGFGCVGIVKTLEDCRKTRKLVTSFVN